MKFFIFLLLALFNLGCSNLTKNTFEVGLLPIRNGVFEGKEWKENLELKRFSWYKEMTLSFEVLLTNLEPNSNFVSWLSKSEKEWYSKCQDPKIFMFYSLDTKYIPNSIVYEQLEINGFTKIDLNDFKRQLLAHPDSTVNSLKLYHIYGLCRENKGLTSFNFTIPGFSTKELK